MTPAQPCPEWKYKSHPQYNTIGPTRAGEVIGTLSTDRNLSAETAIDTRKAHQRLFRELTPPGHEYYAGHYRGESFPCLKECEVVISNSSGVVEHEGEPSFRVLMVMRRFSSSVKAGIMELDRETPISTNQELHRLVVLICRSFVNFLTIHPYADGNGHAARTIMCAIMLHYGFPPVWGIDGRPADPPYSDLIRAYRVGDTAQLHAYVLGWFI